MARVKVNELRTLVVSIDTAVDAVLELDRSHGGKLSTGRLVEACVEEGKHPGLVLSMVWESPNGRTTSEKKWPLAAVAAALIHYCSLANIPLPRNSRKSIELVPEGFRLTLGTHTELNSLHSQPLRASRRRSATQSPPEPRWDEEISNSEGSDRAGLDDPIDSADGDSDSMVA